MNAKRILAWITCLVLLLGSLSLDQWALAQDMEAIVDPTVSLAPEQSGTPAPESTLTLEPEPTALVEPTFTPFTEPTPDFFQEPTLDPSIEPTLDPSTEPMPDFFQEPTIDPSIEPTLDPSTEPTLDPSTGPTLDFFQEKTIDPSVEPTLDPSLESSLDQSPEPAEDPAMEPTLDPSVEQTLDPSIEPTHEPASEMMKGPMMALMQAPENEPLNVLFTEPVPDTVVAGHPITFSWTITGGVEPYTVKWSDWKLTDTYGNARYIESSSVFESSATLIPQLAVTGVFRISVTDNAEHEAYVESPVFTITGAPDRPYVSITLNQSDVEAGQPITASWTITGGVEPYRINYANWWITEANGVSSNVSADRVGNTCTLLPQIGVSGHYYINVSDATGYTEQFDSPGFDIIGADVADPLEISITLDMDTITAGEPITASWEISGGTGPYDVYWSDWILIDANGNERIIDSVIDGNTSKLKPQFGETGRFTLSVRDTAGRDRYVVSEPFTITDAPDRPFVSITLDKSGVKKGEPITASWTITGGVEPYRINYANWWITEANGVSTNVYADRVGDTCTLVPQIGVSGHYYINLSDATGYTEQFDSPGFDIIGADVADPLEISITLDKDTVISGEPITASWEISGGTGPYDVYWSDWILTDANGNERYINSDINGYSSVLLPQVGVTGRFTLSVRDAAGRDRYVVSEPFTITGAVDRPYARILLDKTSVEVGQPITATWTITGGVEPYIISYPTWWVVEANGQGTNVFSNNVGNSCVLKPQFGATAFYFMDIIDAFGHSERFQSPDFTITGAPTVDPFGASIDLDKDTVTAGEPITASWEISGGTKPYDVYWSSWILTDANGNERLVDSAIDGNTSKLTPRFGETGRFTLSIRDAAGLDRNVVSDPFTITGVSEAPAVMFTLDQTSVEVGHAITVSWTITGGEPPFTVNGSEWQIAESNGHEEISNAGGAGSSRTLTPLFGVTGLLRITISDGRGYERIFKSPVFSIDGAGAPPTTPLMGRILLDKETVVANESIRATWNVSGGTAPQSLVWSTWTLTESDGKSVDINGAILADSRELIPRIGVKGVFKGYFLDAVGRGLYIESSEFTITGAPDPLEVSISLNKSTVKAGEPITATWTIAGGVEPVRINRIEWRIIESDGNEAYFNVGNDGSSRELIPRFGTAGYLRMFVTDASGYFEKSFDSPEFQITGAGEGDSYEVSINLSTPSVAVDESITASWTITGGRPIERKNYEWLIREDNGYESFMNAGDSGSSKELTLRFGTTGRFRIYVTDTSGFERMYESEPFAITGAGEPAEPLSVSVNLDTDTVEVGDPITATWNATGGTGPYSIAWARWILTESDETGMEIDGAVEDNTIALTPKIGVRGLLHGSVRDAYGREQYFETPEFTITGAADPLAVSITLDTPSVGIGQPIVASWTITGGVEPVRINRIEWRIIEADGNEAYYNVGNDGGSRELIPRFGTAGYLRMFVTDASGYFEKSFDSPEFTITGGGEGDSYEVSINLSKPSVAVKDTITASWTITGGRPIERKNYEWLIREDNGYESFLNAGDSGSSKELTPLFGTSGRFRIHVADTSGFERMYESEPFAITGAGEPAEPLSVSVNLDMDTVKAGDLITATWNATGGTGPYSIAWARWILTESDGTGMEVDGAVEDNTITLRPKIGVRGLLHGSVRDEYGREQYFESSEFTITGAPGPLEVSISLNKSTVKAGEPITATWTITGGTRPYSFAWYEWPLTESNGHTEYPGGEIVDDSNTLIPQIGETGFFRGSVMDADGRERCFETPKFTITDAAEPLDVSFTLDKTAVVVGEPISASWTVTGGAEPAVANWAEWQIFEANGNNESKWVGEPQISNELIPLFGVSGFFRISLTDANSIERIYDSAPFEIIGATEPADPLTVNVNLNKDTVEAQEPITATWDIAGGTGPYRFDWTNWVLTESDGNQHDVQGVFVSDSNILTPKIGVRGFFQGVVLDNLGRERYFETPEFTITGAADPLTVSITLDKPSVEVGQQVTASWTIMGGRAPVIVNRVEWQLTEINGDYLYRNVDIAGSSSELISRFAGTCRLRINIVDASGYERFFESPIVSITGVSLAEPLAVNITLDKSIVQAGQPITASWSITGGEEPYRVDIAEWYIQDKSTGISESFPAEISDNSAFILPASGSRGFLYLNISDAEGWARSLSSSEFESSLPGDANDDEVVDIMDLVAIIDHLVFGKPVASPANADANGRDGIDLMDLVWIIDLLIS